ncbi:MAG TPA: hypothetical protein VFX37_00670 [Pseudolabrys sp.]|nr:hypothetical protein [Pseudolabrys sp.]
MRLVGTEPHPIYAETDLFTYTCVGCEAIEVVAIPIQTSTA